MCVLIRRFAVLTLPLLVVAAGDMVEDRLGAAREFQAKYEAWRTVSTA